MTIYLGWGDTGGDYSSETLLEIEVRPVHPLTPLQVPIVDWEECRNNTNMAGMAIVDSMLCAGGEGKATCKVVTPSTSFPTCSPTEATPTPHPGGQRRAPDDRRCPGWYRQPRPSKGVQPAEHV